MQFARQIAFAALIPMVAWCAEPSADEVSEQENPDFARYRTIIERMPFGEPPPGFDPTQPPGSASAAAAAAAGQEGMTEEQRTEEEQRLASSVRVSVLNVTPSGRTMVGFTDSSSKPPEHYYLPVGGERDGWKVKEADPATEKITLAKGEVEVTLKLGEGSTGDSKDGKQKGGARNPQPMFARRGGMAGARLAGGPTTPPSGAEGEALPGGPAGAMARLRERRARLMQEQQAEAARKAEAAREAQAEEARREAEQKAAAAEAAAEREQQRAALLQIQEELRRQREEREKKESQEQGEQPE